MTQLQPIIDDELNYNDYINLIIHTRGQWTIPENEYFEKHHILPVCLNGSDSKENLIWLFPEEHYYAHKKLALEHNDNKSLHSAWWLMCNLKSSNQQRNYEVSAYDYAVARRLHADSMKGKNNPNTKNFTDEHRMKISIALKGKPKSAQAIANAKAGYIGKYRGENNALYGKSRDIGIKAVINIDTGEEFRSISDAQKQYNCTGIGLCCTGKLCTSGGYHWKFKELESKQKESKKTVKVQCIEDNKVFNSISNAANYYNTSQAKIKNACDKKKVIKDLNLHFEYIDKVISEPVIDKNKKLVLCIELNLQFNTIKEAADFVQHDRHLIAKCCKENHRTCGGYHWKYI